MKKELERKERVLIGFTLFSMFFGAGNLIFPPFLGAEAGTLTWHAMRGFLLSAVGLPVLGVAAVAMAGGLDRLGRRVHPGFAFVFTLLIYLSIGPCLAIPRTASTSFEMAVLPYLGGLGTALGSRAQLIYSVVFFCIAMALAFRPDKLTDRLGKVLCPTLLILIAVIFTGCLIWPLGAYGAPAKEYADSAAVKGFLEGYQTMDTIAALNFGIIIALNIRAKGVQEDGAVVRETVKAGVIAGLLMAAVYVALAHIGAPAGAKMRYPGNGARILTFVADSLFGRAGMILLGMIFFIACLNTCVGLLSCCSEYFSTILPAVGYRLWVVVFAGVSLLISNAGLDRILQFSVPVLNAIYPVAIVLIALAFLNPLIKGWKRVYPCAILFTGAASVLYALEECSFLDKVLPWLLGRLFGDAVSGAAAAAGVRLEALLALLPGYEAGLGWILPAAAGCVLGILLSLAGSRED